MKTFSQWLKDDTGETLPAGNINGLWFQEHSIPMIVRCNNCDMSLCVVNAKIDDENRVYCDSCADK